VSAKAIITSSFYHMVAENSSIISCLKQAVGETFLITNISSGARLAQSV
jgi:hypothetical protein